MKRVWFLQMIVAGCLCACAAPVCRALDIPAEHHAWGRFPPGSWSRVRVTTLTIDAEGNDKVSQITTTTTRLDKVEPDGVTLTVEIVTDDRKAPATTVKYGWDGFPADADRKTKLSLGEVKIDGHSYVCQTHDVTTTEAGATSLVKWWYCPDRPPYLLKMIARTVGDLRHFTSVEVTGFGIERQVLGQNLVCTRESTIDKTAVRSTRSMGYTSAEVPGGTISWESETRDNEQGLIERARLELEAYDVAD